MTAAFSCTWVVILAIAATASVVRADTPIPPAGRAPSAENVPPKTKSEKATRDGRADAVESATTRKPVSKDSRKERLDPATPPAPPSEVQPGTKLRWLPCPIGLTWRGTSGAIGPPCEGTMRYFNWTKGLNPCPTGYRMPTREEFISLFESCQSRSTAVCDSLAYGEFLSSTVDESQYIVWKATYREHIFSSDAEVVKIGKASVYTESLGAASNINITCVKPVVRP